MIFWTDCFLFKIAVSWYLVSSTLKKENKNRWLTDGQWRRKLFLLKQRQSTYWLCLQYSLVYLQVDSISDGSKLLSPIEWSKLSQDLLCQSIEPICRSWLALEPCLANREDVTEASSMTKNEPEDVSQSVKLRRSIRQGRDLALDYLQRSGKAELYMDVIFFLRFKTTRYTSRTCSAEDC